MAFLFGAIIGSFLNVVIYRFHTGRSLAGHSHCLSCGTRLRWYELFPVVSYLVLRGRCRTCSSYIPPRYMLVEAATGCLFMLGAYHATNVTMLGVEWVLAALLVVIVVYDLNHLIIPDEFVILLISVAAFVLGREWWLKPDSETVVWDIGAALLASGFFAALWLVSKGRWLGLGDAKLLFPLALLVGAGAVFSLVVFSFWVGALISLLIIGWQWLANRGKERLVSSAPGLTIKSEVPFAPFMILAFFLVHYGNYDVLSLILYVYL